MSEPNVYFDFTLDGRPLGRVIFRLHDAAAPRTAHNFRALAAGRGGVGYAGTALHCAYRHNFLLGGDLATRAGRAAYWPYFDDETFALKHDRPYVLSMANAGQPHTNSSQFFVTTARTPWLDGKYVAFGEVVAGAEHIRTIDALGSASGDMRAKIVVAACGVLAPDPPRVKMEE